jgi:hypothetical protein
VWEIDQHKHKDKRDRQKIVDFLGDCATQPDNPLTGETLAELRATWLYFPEGRQMVEKIDAVYGDPWIIRFSRNSIVPGSGFPVPHWMPGPDFASVPSKSIAIVFLIGIKEQTTVLK